MKKNKVLMIVTLSAFTFLSTQAFAWEGSKGSKKDNKGSVVLAQMSGGSTSGSSGTMGGSTSGSTDQQRGSTSSDSQRQKGTTDQSTKSRSDTSGGYGSSDMKSGGGTSQKY